MWGDDNDRHTAHATQPSEISKAAGRTPCASQKLKCAPHLHDQHIVEVEVGPERAH